MIVVVKKLRLIDFAVTNKNGTRFVSRAKYFPPKVFYTNRLKHVFNINLKLLKAIKIKSFATVKLSIKN